MLHLRNSNLSLALFLSQLYRWRSWKRITGPEAQPRDKGQTCSSTSGQHYGEAKTFQPGGFINISERYINIWSKMLIILLAFRRTESVGLRMLSRIFALYRRHYECPPTKIVKVHIECGKTLSLPSALLCDHTAARSDQAFPTGPPKTFIWLDDNVCRSCSCVWEVMKGSAAGPSGSHFVMSFIASLKPDALVSRYV